MNWRITTWINALIALLSISAVGIDFRAHHLKPAGTTKRSDHISAAIRQGQIGNGELAPDIKNVRVDDLASVPASEIQQILLRGSPDELTTLALKFNNLTPNGPTIGAVAMFFQSWAELDGMSALKAAYQLNNYSLKRTAILTVVGSISPSIAPDMLPFLMEHSDRYVQRDNRGMYLSLVVAKWAQIDAPSAAKFLDGLTEDDSKWMSPLTAEEICNNWATVDPMSAISWAKNHDAAHPNAQPILGKAIMGWAANDQAAAANYVANHLEGEGAESAILAVVDQMFIEDPKKATTWLMSLGQTDAKSSAESAFAGWWVKQDAPAAARWLEQLPPDAQQQLAPVVVGGWASSNWSEACKWIAGEKGDLRDNAIATAVIRRGDGVPRSEALSLAMSISNPDTRFESVREIVLDWGRTEPDAAVQWLDTSGLTNRQKEQILADETFSSNSTAENK